MSIRAKLAWTFILLLIFGITAISSYSILFIRNYLLSEGEIQIQNDAEWLSITIENLRLDDNFETNLNEAARTSGYRISIYDNEGVLFTQVPYHKELIATEYLPQSVIQQLNLGTHRVTSVQGDEERLITYTLLQSEFNPSRYLEVSILKDQIYEPIKTIRWIIYTGMFISMGLVVVVSMLFSKSISKPILQLETAARNIASGKIGQTLNLDRKDEFGTLAKSLNRMAEKLQADNQELMRLNQKQNQFFADITHEVKNPLHTIAGSIEMLQTPELSAEHREKYLKTAERQTHRINSLFKDLVTLQRYDSDDHFIQKQRFSIQKVIGMILDIHESEAKEKQIDLITIHNDQEVIGDPDKIEQVLENLINNALKFTNKGTIEINVTDRKEEVLIEIKDSGIGISTEHLEKLFDRFYRTDKARSRDKGGTGLGLAVVKSILNAHGSEIFVESKPAEGTRFWFVLPKP